MPGAPMVLSLKPPVVPPAENLIAELVGGVFYEPRWRGERCILWRYHDEVILQTADGRDLSPAYAEAIEALLDTLPPRCVLDGVLLGSPDAASFVCSDVLALDSTNVTGRSYEERRRLAEVALGNAEGPVWLVPSTDDEAVARGWLSHADAVACLAAGEPYLSGGTVDVVPGTGEEPLPPAALLA